MLNRTQVQQALDAGGGLLRLEPSWVPRSFMVPAPLTASSDQVYNRSASCRFDGRRIDGQKKEPQWGGAKGCVCITWMRLGPHPQALATGTGLRPACC